MTGLQLARGLSSRELHALAELEARTVEADGGRLKLEWSVLEARTGENVEDLLWWDGQRLLGFLGLYSFGAPAVELAGMVDPAARRRGIASALLDAALPLCFARSYQQALLVVPRASAAGRSLALARGAVLEHSEHAFALDGPPVDGSCDPRTGLRPATPADVDVLTHLLASGFGHVPDDLGAQLATDSARTLLVEVDGRTVGTVRLSLREDVGAVYGFVVDSAWQGRGIGRDVLRRVCHDLRSEGARRVCLDVAVDNERALGLYTSLGFAAVTTEDYYALPVAVASPPAPAAP